jgi:hypothetical protein
MRCSSFSTIQRRPAALVLVEMTVYRKLVSHLSGWGEVSERIIELRSEEWSITHPAKNRRSFDYV